MTSDLMTVAEDSVRDSFFLASGAFAATIINAVTAIIIARFLGSELQTASEVLQKTKPLAPIIKPLIKYQEKILNRQQPTTPIPKT